MAKLTSYGAAGTVTGSCHHFQMEGASFLLDCGQFQGPFGIEKRNYQPFGFNPADIEGVVLTHGHFDHCGRIPLLVKQGFQGHVYCTRATRDVARLILLDSAYVQREDFIQRQRKLRRAGLEAPEPLYGAEDVYDALDYFDRPVVYGEPVSLSDRVPLRLIGEDAGHVLGSMQVYLEYPGRDGQTRRLLYTGDLGEPDRPLQNDPTPPKLPVHTLVMESTYGNRDHRSLEESIAEFEEAVVETVKRKGTVLIPSFALERSQEVLYFLGQMKRKGLLAPEVPVFLNSPLAIDMTKVFQRHCQICRSDVAKSLAGGGSPFVFPGIHFTETPDESRAIHAVPGPKIIVAGSGMMTGGRVLHHLKHLLWKDSTTLIVVGYQGEGTLGRKIIEGAKRVRVLGELIAVKARLYTINGFSAHADHRALMRYALQAQPEHIVIVHGEPESAEALSKALGQELPNTRITISEAGKTVDLD